MEKSITQLLRNFTTKLIDLFNENLVSGSFASLCAEAQREACAFETGLLASFFEETDKMILQDADRKKRFYVEKRGQVKRLQTDMGEVELKRTLFKDKKNGKFRYLADELLDIDKYQRIDKGLKAKLADAAAEGSYGKAEALTGGAVSRQTVMNIVHKLDCIKAGLNVSEQRNVPILYVEADEDHIHMQNGKSGQIKLVYVHEGKKEVCKGRKELVNPRFFTSGENNSDKLWREVSEYIETVYDTNNIYIQLHGDGAKWIKNGVQWLPNAEFVLDKFHVFKSLTTATGHCRKLKHLLIKSIKAQDEVRTFELFQQLYEAAKKDSDRKEVIQTEAYIFNNYYEIHLLAEEILYNGCSAEGHVSHMLSSRMSSRPMGWSAHGAEKIAALRAYKKNNGDMLALVTKKQKQESKPYILPKRKYNKLKTAVQQAATIPVAQIPILNASSHYGTKTLVQKTIQQRLKY